jgi:hypothetical protein
MWYKLIGVRQFNLFFSCSTPMKWRAVRRSPAPEEQDRGSYVIIDGGCMVETRWVECDPFTVKSILKDLNKRGMAYAKFS